MQLDVYYWRMLKKKIQNKQHSTREHDVLKVQKQGSGSTGGTKGTKAIQITNIHNIYCDIPTSDTVVILL